MRLRYIILFLMLFSKIESGQLREYFGPHFHYINLKFNESEPIDGYLAGISAGLEYIDSCIVGSLDFEGSLDTNYLRGDPAQKSHVEEYLLQGKIGHHPFCFSEGSTLSFYTGFGWHRLTNNQYPHSISLSYRYDKLFVPVGFVIDYWVCGNLRTALQLEWRPDVCSRLKIKSECIDNQLSQGFRLQLPLVWNYCMRFGQTTWKLTPFYDWTSFGKGKEKTNIGALLKVPSTTRWEVGLRWLVGIDF